MKRLSWFVCAAITVKTTNRNALFSRSHAKTLGMVAVIVILVLLALSTFALLSPSEQQFLNMYSSGWLQVPGVTKVQN